MLMPDPECFCLVEMAEIQDGGCSVILGFWMTMMGISPLWFQATEFEIVTAAWYGLSWLTCELLFIFLGFAPQSILVALLKGCQWDLGLDFQTGDWYYPLCTLTCVGKPHTGCSALQVLSVCLDRSYFPNWKAIMWLKKQINRLAVN